MPTVRSVERAARVLDSLYREPEGKRAADLYRELGLPKTTVLRILRTLVVCGLAERDEKTDRYHRNARFWLSMACDLPGFRSADYTVCSLLRRLEEETGLSVGLGLPDPMRREMIMIDWPALPGSPGTRARDRVSVPMHATALGQVYLASLSPSDLHVWMRKELAQFTERTLMSRHELMEELGRVRERDYAVCRGTYVTGRFAVAVPVRHDRGGTVAAISVGGPEELVTEANIQLWLRPMREASQGLSVVLKAAPLGPEAGQGSRGGSGR